MSVDNSDMQHAALWLIGPDMPGLLNLGSKFVADHGGNIDKDIADKFGEKAVVFMSITATPEQIRKMDADKGELKDKVRGCGMVFQPMKGPTVPAGFKPDLYGFEIVLEDATGLVAEVTDLLGEYHIMVIGHTGERRMLSGPRKKYEGGQKFVVILPEEFDQVGFVRDLTALVKRHNGTLKTPLRTVPGLLWWW